MRFKDVTGLKTDTEVCSLISISKTNFANQKKRGTLYKKLAEWAAQNEIDTDWLLTGKGSQNNEQCVPKSIDSEPNSFYGADAECLIKKTREILESRTDYAQSLAANIKSFHNAIKTEERLSNLEVEFKNQRYEFKKEIDLLKKANLKKEKSIERIVGCSGPGRKEDDHGDVETRNG